MTTMHDEADWFQRIQATTDRLREAADAPNPKPKTVKRPYTAPSGATQRAMKARNAYQRVQRKQTGGK